VDVEALQRCVGDVSAFFSRHWAQAPLLLRPERAAARNFDDLASLDDLDRIIASRGLQASRLRMVKDAAPLPPSSYTSPAGGRARGAEDVVNPALVYMRYEQGATIVLESLHRNWEPLTDFCRDLEQALGHRLQVNAYITPPGAQGFAVHRDDHDVFVLQVSGSKHWIVYDRDHQDRVLIDREIGRGSSLYIPKGFPHAARTGGSASAHLTVGILTHDGADIVRELAKLAEEEPTFRERLPAGAASDPASLRSAVERRVDEVRSWLDKVDVDELTERVARRVMSSAQPILRGQLQQLEALDDIGAESVVARRRGASCFLFPTDTALRVLLPDRQLEMPLIARPAMEEVARRRQFRVGDLDSFLDADSALVLVRRLVREGLLEVVVAR
jgi:bifunctional lysine-specific demethylase and histidyl-hydroxylase NO66